jgi:RNA polymerase primary sigma factor
LSESIGKIRWAEQKLEQALNRFPTNQEIADVLGIPVEKVATAQSVSKSIKSLDEPAGEDTLAVFGDFIEDTQADDVPDIAANHLMQSDLAKALATLTEREREILTLHYGLIDGQKRTLAEIGKMLGFTRERARQIEAEALKKLRAPGVGEKLRGYLE